MNNFRCCSDLADAMTVSENSFFRIEDYEEGEVLFLTTGWTQTLKGVRCFEEAVGFCPFCGKKLQDRNNVPVKSQEAEAWLTK
jgi:hypothetical protein